MPLIPEEEIERIKRETDLAAVVRSRGIELKPKGGDLIGLCPFHDDHHPSLHVTPRAGLWRCPSCKATGNVIQFVQRYDGVSFRHAIELLKEGKFAALAGPAKGAPVSRWSRMPKLAPPVAPDADDQAALRQVLDYYHTKLKENVAALTYLEKRGLKNDEAIAAFKIGLADRTLGLRLPPKTCKDGEAIRTRLEKLGLYRDTGREHFNGRIVFPVIAENGEIGTIYGRALGKVDKDERHLFLPGPRCGIWNPVCLRSPEIIITEGIIDALTFWCAGYRNVTTTYSSTDLPEELLDALVTAKVRLVFIAFDRDKSGDEGAEKMAAQLMARGIECRRVLFPHGQDANEYARQVQPAAKSLGVLLNAAAWMGKGKVSPSVAKADAPMAAPSSDATRAPSSLAAKAASSSAAGVAPTQEKTTPIATSAPALATPAIANDATKEKTDVPSLVLHGEHWFLTLDGREYRAGGLEKNLTTDAIKIALRLKVGDKFHLDSLDLARDAERRRFVERAAEETGLHADLLKRDMGKLLLAVEQTQAELVRPAETMKTVVRLSEAERAAGLELLRAPDLLARIVADMTACGLVGEDRNKLATYVAVVSRLLDRPLAVIIRATTAAGKSTLMDGGLALMPSECRVKYSALTGQALYYLGGETDLKHKILAIVEEEGAEKASYALKLLQSEGELSIASTGKDPKTGRMVTQEYRVEGPVMIFLTTTAVDLDEELLNRCIVLTVDESREQTAAIHAAQRRAETLAGLIEDERRAQLIALHHAAQRLLRPLKVVNPYGERLTFPEDRTRTRRDHKKYLTLIRTIALLHQYQRPVKTRIEHGRPVEYIEATIEDIAAANALAHEILGRSLDDMPPQTRALLELIERMVTQRCAATKIERGDARFRARHVREFTGWGHTQLHVHLQRLVALEYLIPHRSDHGQGLVYELLYDGGGKNGAKFLPGLIDVAKLRTYDAERPGVNGERPAPVRPTSGPVPGGVRPGQNGDSSSENGATEAKTAKNARPEAARKTAA
jgi:DNA primase